MLKIKTAPSASEIVKQLFFGRQFFQPVHVRPEDLGDIDAAVFVLVVLQQGDENSRRSDAGIVQGIAELGLAVTVPILNVQPPALVVV